MDGVPRAGLLAAVALDPVVLDQAVRGARGVDPEEGVEQTVARHDAAADAIDPDPGPVLGEADADVPHRQATDRHAVGPEREHLVRAAAVEHRRALAEDVDGDADDDPRLPVDPGGHHHRVAGARHAERGRQRRHWRRPVPRRCAADPAARQD